MTAPRCNRNAPEAWLVAGLGNPGARYDRTRHNVGFMVVDRVARDRGVRFRSYGKLARLAELKKGTACGYLLKPMVYMNRSGRAVGDLAVRKRLDTDRILVVVDDFNLPFGKLRFRAGGSDGGHNGLASIIRTLGTDEFPRLRCGIGQAQENRAQESDAPGEMVAHEFVLSEFLPDEADSVEQFIERAAAATGLWIDTGDLEQCMNLYN